MGDPLKLAGPTNSPAGKRCISDGRPATGGTPAAFRHRSNTDIRASGRFAAAPDYEPSTASEELLRVNR
jgi:hypothetical protein